MLADIIISYQVLSAKYKALKVLYITILILTSSLCETGITTSILQWG